MASFNELVDALVLCEDSLKCFYSFIGYDHCSSDLLQDDLNVDSILKIISEAPEERVVRQWLCRQHRTQVIISILMERVYHWKREQGLINTPRPEILRSSEARDISTNDASSSTPIRYPPLRNSEPNTSRLSTIANSRTPSPIVRFTANVSGSEISRNSLGSTPGRTVSLPTTLNPRTYSPAQPLHFSSQTNTPIRSPLLQGSPSAPTPYSAAAIAPEAQSPTPPSLNNRARGFSPSPQNDQAHRLAQSSHPNLPRLSHPISSSSENSERRSIWRPRPHSSTSEPQLPRDGFTLPTSNRSTHTRTVEETQNTLSETEPDEGPHAQISQANTPRQRPSVTPHPPGAYAFFNSGTALTARSSSVSIDSIHTDGQTEHTEQPAEASESPNLNFYHATEFTDPFSDDGSDLEDCESAESRDEAPEAPFKLRLPSEDAIRQTPSIPDDHSPQTIDDRIRTLITATLPTKSDPSNKGFVYIFRDPQRSHLFKIGMTDKTITERRKKIERTCKIILEPLYQDSFHEPGEHRFLRPFAHAQRAEQLIGKELEPWKRCYECPTPTCRRRHKEWFEVDEDTAMRTVQRWVRFMHGEPYDGAGKLKQFWKEKLENMDRPLRDEKLEDRYARHKRWERVLSTGRANWQWWAHSIRGLLATLFKYRWQCYSCLLAILLSVEWFPCLIAALPLIFTLLAFLCESMILRN